MRDLTTAFKTAARAKTVLIGIICEIDYSPTPVRVWAGKGSLSWDSKTWTGVGDFGGISAIQERPGAQAGNMTLTLAAVNATMRSLALQEASAGRTAKVWIALFTESGGVWSVIADPWLCNEGLTDVHKIGAGVVEVTVENVLSRLKYPRVARYSDAEQQRHFPGDTAGRYASVIDSQPFYWGVPTPTMGQTGSVVGGGKNGGHYQPN